MSKDSFKINSGHESIDFDEDEDDSYWPEGVPRNHAWNESTRDWIGDGKLEGLEGQMSIRVSYYGCTQDQRELINRVLLDLGSEARELFQKLIDRESGKKSAN